MNLHLHHPEREAGPCNPAYVREAAEAAQRAARFAADIAWDQRQDAACERLNAAAWSAQAALATLPQPNPYAEDARRLNRGETCGKCGEWHAVGRCPEAV